MKRQIKKQKMDTKAYYEAVDKLVSSANGYYYKTISVLNFLKTVLIIAGEKSR